MAIVAPPSPRRFWRLGGCGLLVVVLLGGSASMPRAESAAAVLQRHQAVLVAAKRRDDWRRYLAEAIRLQTFLNDAPVSWLEIARARNRVGDKAGAREAMRRFLALGQTSDLFGTSMFPPLTPALRRASARNASSVVRARTTAVTIGAGLPAEDIGYDAGLGRFLVTTVLGGQIIAIAPATNSAVQFAASPDHWPMLALVIDQKRRRLWATEVALDGFASVPSSAWGQSAILEYDLDRHKLLARYAGPIGSSLGDMTLDTAGDPVVSDGKGGGIYRLRHGALRRIDRGDFVSPQTATICAGGRQAFVPDYVRGIAGFDLDTGAVHWLSGARHAMDGVDGLYCRGRVLIATQNGASPQRVVRFHLDSRMRSVIGEDVIDRRTDGDFTHGVYVGRTFYYLDTSGWNEIDSRGKQIGTPPAKPAGVRQFAL